MRLSAIGLILALTFGLFAVPLATAAQQIKKVPKVGMLAIGSPPASPDWQQRWPFWQGMHELGWIEGQNITMEYRWAFERYDRLADLAAELVRLKVDVLVASDTAALHAVRHATSTIPIVMFYVGDPVADGVVTSLARPGGNVTGVSCLAPELSGKLLELLKEAVPDVTRMAVLVNTGNPMRESILTDVESAARVLGVQLQILEVGDPQEFKSAFDTALREGAGALLVAPGLLSTRYQRRLAALTVQSRLPAIYWQRPFVEAGGLMAYGPSMAAMGHRATAFVDKILKGAKPADLPVEQAMKFELVINLKTARALGLTIPPHLLVLADEVIQ
jgi:putative tryptophan/tyrosine transport system substrate-binding protein